MSLPEKPYLVVTDKCRFHYGVHSLEIEHNFSIEISFDKCKILQVVEVDLQL